MIQTYFDDKADRSRVRTCIAQNRIGNDYFRARRGSLDVKTRKGGRKNTPGFPSMPQQRTTLPVDRAAESESVVCEEVCVQRDCAHASSFFISGSLNDRYFK